MKQKLRTIFNRIITTDSQLKRNLAILAVPIFIETLLMMALGAVDTFMLSRHSDGSVAAVGLVNQILNFCLLVFEVISLGTSILCSQYLGARMRDKMETVVGISLIVNLVSGVVMSVALFSLAEPILRAMGLSGIMLDEGTSYMRIAGAGSFVMAIGLTLSAALRSDNKAYYPMMVIAIINVVNVIGNYTLIFGKFGAPELGVTGAAISTVASRTIAMIVLFFIVFRTTMSRFPTEIFRRFPTKMLVQLLRIGLPSAGEMMSYSSAQLVITYFINTLGVEAMATRTYCVNIVMFGYLFCIAVAQGGAICIGHLVGAQREQSAFILGKYVMKKAVGYTVVLSFIIACCGSWIISLLTENEVIRHLAVAVLWIDVVLEIGRPINIFATNALRAAGDVNYPFYVGVVVQWSVAVLASYLLGIVAGFGLLGMWCMFALDENIRGFIFVRRWYSDKWKGKGINHVSVK